MAQGRVLRLSLGVAGLLSYFSAALGQMSVAHWQEVFSEAARCYQAGRWEEAESGFLRISRADVAVPRCQEAIFFLGETRMQMHRYREAREAFEAFAQRHPNDPQIKVVRALFRIGEASYLLGNRERAESELTSFVKAHGDDPLAANACLYLGDLAMHRQDFSDACDRYRRGEQLAEGLDLRDQCALGLARATEASGDLDAARGLYQRLAADASRQSTAARYCLGLLEQKAGDDDAAEQWLRPLAARRISDELRSKVARQLRAIDLRKQKKGTGAASPDSASTAVSYQHGSSRQGTVASATGSTAMARIEACTHGCDWPGALAIVRESLLDPAQAIDWSSESMGRVFAAAAHDDALREETLELIRRRLDQATQTSRQEELLCRATMSKLWADSRDPDRAERERRRLELLRE